MKTFKEFLNENNNNYLDIWNQYLKLVSIIDGIISENGELSDSLWREGVESKLDELTNGDVNLNFIKTHIDEIIQNYKDLYDGLEGWYMEGRKNFGKLPQKPDFAK